MSTAAAYCCGGAAGPGLWAAEALWTMSQGLPVLRHPVESGSMTSPRDLSDETLVALIVAAADRNRSQTLSGELFSRYERKVALWCYRFSGDREAAADLAQEVFLTVHRRLSTFKGGARFSTWLYAIVRNRCLNHLQASRRHESLDLDEVGEAHAASEKEWSAGEIGTLRHQLSKLLTRNLDEIEQQVMVLHFGHSMPLDSLTRLLELDNASGAKAYVVSAKRKLKRAIARHEARSQRLRLVDNRHEERHEEG